MLTLYRVLKHCDYIDDKEPVEYTGFNGRQKWTSSALLESEM